MDRKCPKHGVVEHFARKDDGYYRCGKCSSDHVVANRRRKKARLVELFGGKCALCGYKKYMGALDFHHKDPTKKSFALSVKGLCYSWDSVLREARKCVVLCKNCHAEVEAGVASVR